MTEYGGFNAEGDVTPVPADPGSDGTGDSAHANAGDVVAPTEATDDQAVANSQPADDSEDDHGAKAAAAQRASDEQFRSENPNSPVARSANPAVGGEGF